MKFENGEAFLTQLRIIFYALLAGPLLLFFFLILQEKNGNLSVYWEVGDSVLFVRWSIGLVLAGLTGFAYVMYNKSLAVVRVQGSLREKLRQYWAVNMKKYVLMSASCILALFAHFLTLDPIFKAVYIFVMIIMAISSPGLYSLLKDLRANREEAIILKKNLPIP
ncbi:MAG: hypothetical protein ACPGJS_07375 [Flammeovirgaceae bacterium]